MALHSKARTAIGSIVSFLLAAGVCAWLLLGSTARDGDGVRLIHLAFTDLEELVVERRDEPPVVLVRSESGWSTISPVETPADQRVVEELIEYLLDLDAGARPAPPGDADSARYGLDAPRLSVELTGSGDSARIHLGDTSPFDGRIFTSNHLGDLFLLESDALDRLDRGLFDLRDKRVFNARAPIDEIRVEAAGTGYLLFKDEQGWRVAPLGDDASAKPVDEPASSREVSRALGAIRGARAFSFPLPETLPDLDPELLVSVRSGGEETSMVIASAIREGARRYFVVGGRLGPLAEIGGDLARSLRAEHDALVRRKVLEFDGGAVRRVEIVADEALLAAELRDLSPKTPGAAPHRPGAPGFEWALVEPHTVALDAWRVPAILHALENLEATELAAEAQDVASLAPYGLGEPSREVRLLDGEGKLVAALHLGASPRPGRLYVTDEHRRRVLVVPEARLINLPSTVEEIAPKKR